MNKTKSLRMYHKQSYKTFKTCFYLYFLHFRYDDTWDVYIKTMLEQSTTGTPKIILYRQNETILNLGFKQQQQQQKGLKSCAISLTLQ